MTEHTHGEFLLLILCYIYLLIDVLLDLDLIVKISWTIIDLSSVILDLSLS